MAAGAIRSPKVGKSKGQKVKTCWRGVLAACGLVVLAAGCSNKPPSVPLVLGPTMARPKDSLAFSARSVDADQDSLSYQFSWGDGQETDWGGWIPAGDQYVQRHVFQDSGLFLVSARVRDVKHETGWAESLPVRIRDYGPFVPSRPAGPDTVAVLDTTRFISAAGHPLREKVALQFDWGDTLGEWSRFVAPDTIVKMRHVYYRGGIFGVRARAKDSLEHVSEWSSAETVMVVGK